MSSGTAAITSTAISSTAVRVCVVFRLVGWLRICCVACFFLDGFVEMTPPSQLTGGKAMGDVDPAPPPLSLQPDPTASQMQERYSYQYLFHFST